MEDKSFDMRPMIDTLGIQHRCHLREGLARTFDTNRS